MKAKSVKDFYCFLQSYINSVEKGERYSLNDVIASPLTWRLSKWPEVIETPTARIIKRGNKTRIIRK